MKKIKKFKVNLRKREIIRNLKLIFEIKEITPQIEEIVDSEIKNSTEYLLPASVYSSFTQDEMMVKLGPDFLPSMQKKQPLNPAYGGMGKQSRPGAGQPLGATFIAVTVGAAVEEEIKRRQDGGETIHAAIVRALGIEAVEASLNFVLKLAADEAKREDSVLLSPEKLDGQKTALLVKALEAKKIGIYVNDKGQVQPEFSTVVAVQWK